MENNTQCYSSKNREYKANFVKNYLSPLIEHSQCGWDGCEYYEDPETDEEFVYLTTEYIDKNTGEIISVRNDDYKVNVTCDSRIAICKDVLDAMYKFGV